MLIYTFFLNLNALHTPCTHLSLLFQCFVYLHLHAAASGTSSWGCGKGSSRNQKKYLFRNRCSVKACNTAGTSIHNAVVNRRVFHQQLYFSETLVEILRDKTHRTAAFRPAIVRRTDICMQGKNDQKPQLIHNKIMSTSSSSAFHKPVANQAVYPAEWQRSSESVTFVNSIGSGAIDCKCQASTYLLVRNVQIPTELRVLQKETPYSSLCISWPSISPFHTLQAWSEHKQVCKQ